MAKIITHPGSAHVDDLLSTSLVIYKAGDIEKVERKKPTQVEINDPNIWKLDIGNGFNPELKLFDHHQEDMEDCSFSLLLKTWKEWDRAIEVHEWLETAIKMDVGGPKRVIEFLNTSRHAFNGLTSFVEIVILRLFQEKNIIKKEEWLFKLLNEIGKEFFEEIDDYFNTLSIVEKEKKVYEIKGIPVIECSYDIKPTSNLLSVLYRVKSKIWGEGGIAVYPNDRPIDTIAIKRFDDDKRIDFNQIADMGKVIFAHKNGFFAAVEKVSDSELKQYIEKAIIE